jgi:hypothetical protein
MALVPLSFALLCGGVFVLALAALGIFLVIYGARSRQKAGASRTWPSIEGHILSAEVKQTQSTDDDGRVRYAYYPAVTYDYVVAGQAYTGTLISFGGVMAKSTPEKAQDALARFPEGSQASVYYNPANPAEAVLVREEGAAKWALWGGIFCLVLAACIACPLVIGAVRAITTMAGF